MTRTTLKEFLATRRVAGWLRLALIAAAPLLLGSVHPPVIVAESLACIAVLILTLLPGHRGSGWSRVYPLPWLILALVAGVALTLLQLVPLPAAVGALAPAWAHVWGGAETLAGRTGWHPISLDPAATALEALRGLGLASLALAQAIVVRREGVGAIRRALWAVASGGVFSVAVFTLRWATHAPELLGFYLPVEWSPSEPVFRATFVSGSQQAAFAGLAMLASIPLALDPRRPNLRIVGAAVLGVCFTALVLTLSLPAWLAFGLAAALMLGVQAIFRRKGGLAIQAHVAAAAAIVLVLATAFAVSHSGAMSDDELTPRASNLTTSRLDDVRDAVDLVRDHAILGIGRGALEATFPAYNRRSPGLRFHHLDNQGVEAVAEWGVSGALLLLLLAIAFVAAARRQVRGPVTAGPVAALFGIALYDLAGFSLASNGVALPAAALLGCMAAGVVEIGDKRSGFESIPGPKLRRKPLIAIAIALLFLAIGLATRPFGPSLAQDVDSLQADAAAGTLADASLCDATIRHPASYLVPLIAGEWTVWQGNPKGAYGWLDRADQLAPHQTEARVIRIRALLLEHRYAEARALWQQAHDDPNASSHRALAAIYADPRLRDRVVHLAPLPDPAHETTLDLATFLAEHGRDDLARVVFDSAARALPDDPVFVARLGKAWLDAGEVDRADRIATHVMVDHPNSPEGYDLLGMVFEARGRVLEAHHLYLEAARLVPADPEPLFQAAGALLAGGTTGGLEAVLGRIEPLCADVQCRWRLVVVRSRIAEVEGMTTAAIDFMEEAERLRPGEGGNLLRVADLNERAGNLTGAALALRRHLARHPDDPVVRARLDRISPAAREPTSLPRPDSTPRPLPGRKKVW